MIITGDHPTYKSPKNGIAWLIGADSKMIEAVIRPNFEQMIPKRYKENGKWNGKNSMWSLKSDGREWEVWFKSVDSGRSKFQGAKLDFLWCDEEPRDPSVFVESEMRLIDNQGIWLLTATPVEGTKWLKDTLERDDVYHTMAGMRENPYIPLDEIEKISRQLTDDERMVRVEGKYIIFGGRPVFDRQLLEVLEKDSNPYQEGLLVAI
jgi:phage terminase large subunit-like protein